MSDALEKAKAFMKNINTKYKKQYGGDVLYTGKSVGNFQPFETGFPTFDWVNSGIGGYPRGGMTLIHGLESTGKSSFVLAGIEHQLKQNPDITGLYIDAEGALTEDFLRLRGVDPERIQLTQLNCEDALQIAEDSLKQNIYDIVVLDSLAKFEPSATMEKDMGESKSRAGRASMLSDFMRRMTFCLRKSKTALICINQEIDNQERKTKYDPPTVLPCGRQQKYSANLRIELKRSKAIKRSDGTKLGFQMSATSIKNKIAPKERAMTYLSYLYDRGFVRELSLVDYLLMIGKIKKGSLGRYEFVEKELYANMFKYGDIIKIAKEIKELLGIDLYTMKPSSDFQYEKNENIVDVKARDEIGSNDGVSTAEEPEEQGEVEI